MKLQGILASALLFGFSVNGYATLTPTVSNGINLVYSSVSDVTWTQSANVLLDLIQQQGYNNIVSSIINDSPIVRDFYYTDPVQPAIFPINSWHQVTELDFTGWGGVSVYGGFALINYLNDTDYAGSNNWRFPQISHSILPNSGFNVNSQSELDQLYYNELGLPPNTDITSTDLTSVHNIFSIPWNSYAFRYASPYMNYNFSYYGYEDWWQGLRWELPAWIVTPGFLGQAQTVAPVPLPSAVWLFGSALAGFGLLNRRKTA